MLASSIRDRTVAVIGGGPAGLMAAEILAEGGAIVWLFDAMPSVGRKFLLAGRGGMNLTHSEPLDSFLSRYGVQQARLAPLVQQFPPHALRDWVHGLGIDTFVGSSGRVFPSEMKAAPLLRAWLHRLRETGVQFHMRHRWLGWQAGEQADQRGALRFATPDGEILIDADAVVLALGGGSWARLGSDAAWVPILTKYDVAVRPLQPANCGFDTNWTKHFRERFAGHPLKTVVASCVDVHGTRVERPGECMVTATGLEGGLIYALSSCLRDQIGSAGTATLTIDLSPGKSLQRLTDEIAHPRGSRSMASHLQSRAGIAGVKSGLLREVVPAADFADPARLAAAIKSLPVKLFAPRPIDEAISTAGGVMFETLDANLMISSLPGVFCAGEMLDWEAPTGGYLLSACFASGRSAGAGVLDWLAKNKTAVANATAGSN